MNTSLSWIKAYVPELSCTDQEYADAMTLSGTKVETYKKMDKNLSQILVGRILDIQKHPDADKLIICTVDIGSENIQIVTGAPNVHVNDLVPVVLPGGKVAGGHDGGPLPENGIPIKKGKLRGVESFGMMCSIEELGSDKMYYPKAPDNGIYIFDEGAKPGEDAIELLGLHDTVFEYEITSNRVDCYSVLGIAREAAVTFRKAFLPPVIEVKEGEEKIEDYLSVEVQDKELCPRYCARVCTDIKIAPSPEWMQRRLSASGIRPINNLVDITNYVMEEFGQPMHAFDLDTISGNKIIVKRALDQTTFQTLDGQIRKLDSDMLMICDAEKEIGIAGIMGGENSKITDQVKTVVFESAVFNGANIRKSAKRLGLRTDASGKFEKGLDVENAEAALNRACQLMEELGCGKVTQGMIDIRKEAKKTKIIPFEPTKINRLLGTDLEEDLMKDILKRLELSVNHENMIDVPSFRQDIEGNADISEEIARFYGYDKIPSTLPKGEATTGKLPQKLRIEEKARDIMEFFGFSQAMCYSFESPKVFDKLGLAEDDIRRKAIKISNPLGEDFSIMRSVPLNGMLTSLATNYNRRNKDVRLYELGNIYIPEELPLKKLPDERMQLTLGMYGEGDFFDLKGVIEEFFEKIGMFDKVKYVSELDAPFLHPGRRAKIIYNNEELGYLGEIHPQTAAKYDLGTKAYIAVLDMEKVVVFSTFDRKYSGVPKYPSVQRDLSLVVPETIPAGDIEDVIANSGGKLLEEYYLYDIYQGSQIKAGFKSMTYTIRFRSNEKTLEESDITPAVNKILKKLEIIGIELRQ